MRRSLYETLFLIQFLHRIDQKDYPLQNLLRSFRSLGFGFFQIKQGGLKNSISRTL